VYMLRNCRKSCETCGITDEAELVALSEKKLALHEVGGDETLLETPYGVTQSIVDGSTEEHHVKEIIANFTSYMENIIFQDPKYAAVKKTCKNRHPMCSFWKHIGECEKVSRIVYMRKGMDAIITI
jgi:hypothetical protein